MAATCKVEVEQRSYRNKSRAESRGLIVMLRDQSRDLYIDTNCLWPGRPKLELEHLWFDVLLKSF